MAVIARVHGTALVPGVSRNNRLYTRELIAGAVARVQERIASPDGMPITTRTHHAAEDDSLRLVGHVTSMRLAEDGSAKYTAVLTDTPEGRQIAALTEDHGGKPVLRGVSIRGAWTGGPARRVQHEGRTVETGDGLEIDGLDYTATPGVSGARINWVEMINAGADTPETVTGDGRTVIFETSAEWPVVETVREADGGDGRKPYGDVAYADPGYQPDRQKRYPVDTKAHARAAWSYVNQADNARLYTSAQLKRIRQRVVKALKGFGVQVATQEGWLIEPASQVSEALAEAYGMDQPGQISVCLSNGPVTVTVCSYCVDPHDLDLIGRAAMDGACKALATIDPDMDGDMDVSGAPAEDRDNDMETAPPGSAADTATEAAPAAPVTEQDQPPPSPPDPHPADAPTEPPSDTAGGLSRTGQTTPEPPAVAAGGNDDREEPAVSEPTTPAADAAAPPAVPPGITFSDDQFAQLLARLIPQPAAAAAESVPVPAAPATESTPPAAPAAPAATGPAVTETDEDRITRIVESRIAAERTRIVQELVESGNGPARKGLVAPVSETNQSPADGGLNEYGLPADWPAKPPHQYTPEERRRYFNPALQQHVLGDRAKS